MDTLLQAIAEGSSIKESAVKAGVSPAAHYHWLATQPGYQEGFELAKRIRAGRAKDEMMRRAIDGYEEVTTFTEVNEYGEEVVKGRKIHKKYDTALLLRFLEAEIPEEFTKQIKKEVTHTTIADTLAAARRRLKAAQGNNDTEQ